MKLLLLLPSLLFIKSYCQTWQAEFDKVVEAELGGGPYIVQKGEKWGAVSSAGEIILPLDYDEVHPCINRWDGHHEFAEGFNRFGYAVLRKGHHWGMIDSTGKIILPFEYQNIGTQFGYWLMDKGLIGIEKHHQWGLADSLGNVVIEPVYKCLGDDDCIPYFDHGWMAFISTYKKSPGYLNANGEEIIPQGKYVDVAIQKQGYLIVMNKKEKFGVVNPDGEVIIEPKYFEVKPDIDRNGHIRYFEAYDEEGQNYIDFDLKGNIINDL